MITMRYYYTGLSSKQRSIYKKIYDGIINYNEYVDVSDFPSLTNQAVGWIYHCILWDNPYIFSIGEYAIWNALSADKKRVKIVSLCDRVSEQSFRRQVEEAVNNILRDTRLQKMTDFQKEVFVHDYIIKNVEYDHTLGNNGSRLEPYTVFGALIQKKAVCEGIAKTAKLLLNLLDVKCIVVSGTYEGHPHAWNIVKLKDFSYNLDVTMDMGRVIHPGKMRYNYFNFRDSDMNMYSPDRPEMLPKCEAIGQNYLIKAGGFVSNYERLKKYILIELNKHRTCLYLKPNRNVDEDYKNISFYTFKNEVERALQEVIKEHGFKTSFFIDSTGPGEIVNVEVEYL